MAKKQDKICKTCFYDGEKCTHKSNEGVIVKYRQEQKAYFKTPDELNKDGNCPNYVELPKK